MNVFVIAAHPDDELLGVGATVARHVEEGDAVYALILGEGQTSRFGHREDAGKEILKELHEDTLKAAAEVGFKDVFFADFPDNRFDHVDLLDIVKTIERYVENYQPEVIYTHHGGDMNIDHQRTFQAVLTATRPMEDCPVKEIYAFETVSSTEWNFAYGDQQFKPNYFVRVTKEQFEKKLRGMEAYRSELRDYPHPRSLKMLQVVSDRWAGVVGGGYVEAFELIRSIR